MKTIEGLMGGESEINMFLCKTARQRDLFI